MKLSKFLKTNNLIIRFETRHHIDHEGVQNQYPLWAKLYSIKYGKDVTKIEGSFGTTFWQNAATFEEAVVGLCRQVEVIGTEGYGTEYLKIEGEGVVIHCPETIKIDIDISWAV